MDWPALRQLMLQEPKPTISFVIRDNDPERSRSARVMHDGDKKWLIWSTDKIEFNDGEHVVIADHYRTIRYPARELYSHGWIKSLVHPRLTNVAEEGLTAGVVVASTTVEELHCWTVEVEGLREGDPSTFTLTVLADRGVVVSVSRAGLRVELEEISVGGALPEALFTWSGPVDREESFGQGDVDGQL